MPTWTEAAGLDSAGFHIMLSRASVDQANLTATASSAGGSIDRWRRRISILCCAQRCDMRCTCTDTALS